jgi:Uma2 family endonuclease
MDTLVHPTRSGSGPTTDAARRFTADEFEAMARAGIINEAERIELIDGRLVAMSAKGNRHEVIRNKLQKF